MDISHYEYLWTSKNYDYVLVKGSCGYLIVNRNTKGVFLLENEKLAKQIEEKMLQRGVPIYESGKHLQNGCLPINIVGQPTPRDEFPEKRYKLFIEWSKYIPLIIQVRKLKKLFSIVNSKSNQSLLEIARNCERWQFDIQYLDEIKKTEILNLSEEHGLRIILEVDELREWY